MTIYTQIPYSPTVEPTKQSYGKDDYLKVPIAMIGEWEHPEYGKVKFDQNDFNDIVRNWENGAAGYDVSLWKGHPVSTTAIEGQESEGWLSKLQQEGNILWGYYQPTDTDLYDKVASKKFKYASAEVVRNAVDKKNGNPLGTMLVGDALTNRPFLPFKDITLEIVSLCDSASQIHLFTFQITPEDNMPDNITEPISTVTPATAVVQPPAQSLSDKTTFDSKDYVAKADYDALLLQLADSANNSAVLASKIASMEQILADLHAKDKERELNEDLAQLDKLTLDAKTKQVFSDMFKTGTMTPEAKAALFQGAEEKSQATIEKFTTVEGTLEPEVNAERGTKTSKKQAFAEAILANAKKVAEQRGYSIVPNTVTL